MDEIARMAALCMKDIDDEEVDDEDLDDEDLLAELNEVLEMDDESSAPAPTPTIISPSGNQVSVSSHSAPRRDTSVESRLTERIDMYKTAICNAKDAGETNKVRRYERGLKTLQSMLTSVKKGKPINEDEIPPPVALGGKPTAPVVANKEPEVPESAVMFSSSTIQKPLRESLPATPNIKPVLLNKPQNSAPASLPEPAANVPVISQSDSQNSEWKELVLSRQKEYKLAAINAKQVGDIERAKQFYLTSKQLDLLLEALSRHEQIDPNSLPPPLGDLAEPCASAPPPSSSAVPTANTTSSVASAELPTPRSVGEALQQRMDIYKSAAETAKSNGDDRKARMHQRIVKQYQDAIKTHKAGRPVTLSDLPVPPGCPPFPGSESNQTFTDIMGKALKIANQDPDAEDDDDDESPLEGANPQLHPSAKSAKSPAPPVPGVSAAPKYGPKVQQQVDFLMLRRKGFLKAALHSKQMKDMSGATQHLRHAKGLDPMIAAAKSGLPVDITKIPDSPEEDYSLTLSRTSRLSSNTHEQYHGVMDLLRKQHKKCVASSQQFAQMGNVAEALRCEKLAEECVKNIEILKNAYTNGHRVPKCRTEERTFNTCKIHSNLTSSELLLYIIRGINLPAPPGVSSNDMDTTVKYEFPFPSMEDAQRNKTSTVKNTNSPEFKEQFKLNINRNHRGFKRVVQSKGIKFEIVHKGGLFKTDRVIGTAQLKLETLENHCELREIIEVMNGRKATGGKLEVKVKIREPLTGLDLQPVTEKWLVLDPVSSLSPPEKKKKDRAPSPRSNPRHEASGRSNQSPQYKLHSFSLLTYDRERLERKIEEYRKNRRDPPPDLIHQLKSISHRVQWQKAELQQGSPALLTEYENVLQRLAQGLSDAVKKYSSQGNRDAAKDALGRFKLVETELESLRRNRTK
ncbi:coiled-coil and C2 domain-containing protein 1A [Cynoglossus semilaevis]|uniref:coiled-coil and C2 domain-containing protein 1A n=1 Tax=Cynoglossus semilaevis TaxID=244447 RepID=UPI0004960DC5|nr:coiled-coil and C2 domain-containing protein 1A-like [Cynoglossus semilaevis]